MSGIIGSLRIARAVQVAAADHGIALVPFVTAGFPRPESFRDTLCALAEHAAVIEIGVPFTDPMADGVSIQRASRAALESGVTLRWILEQLRTLRQSLSTPLVLMSYLNPLLALGTDLAGACAAAGVAGLIVPDLPLEECAGWRRMLHGQGVGLIQMATPLTPAERLVELGRVTDGFLYAVTMSGVTGGSVGLNDEVCAYLDRARAACAAPVCAGFGVRTRADVARLRGHAHGAIIGSAMVECLGRGDDPAQFLAALRP